MSSEEQIKINRVSVVCPENCLQYKVNIIKCIGFLKEKYPHNIIIQTTGQTAGGEYDAKEMALQLKLPYIEFNPGYTNKNEYSYFSDEYFGKSKNITYFIKCYDDMLYRSDYAIICIDDKIDKIYKNIILKYKKKLKEKVYLI